MTHLLKATSITMAAALILSLQPAKLYSQSTYLKPLIVEVNNNFNYGNSNSTIKSHKKNVKGILVGTSFQAGITPSFSVVAETYFSTKGAELKAGNPLTSNQSRLRLYSAEMPVLARLHIKRFYLNAGPYISYAIGGRIKTAGSATTPAKSNAVSFKDVPGGFKRWEMGVQAGAGYHFRIKKNTLALDLRYGYGLTNISQDAERYNRTFTISFIAIKPWKTNPFGKKTGSSKY